MYRKCCVPECKSLRQDVKLHQFPKSEEMKRKWLRCIKCDLFSETRNMFVCHKHFERKFIKDTSRLKMGAYPTLFTDLEITSGESLLFSNETDKCSDHNSYHRKRHFDHTYALPYDQRPNKIVRREVSDSILLSPMQDQQPIIASTSSSQNILPGLECTSTPRKLVKRRLVRNVKSLTPRCQFLYKEYKKVRHQNNYNVRVKRALNFSKNKSFEDIMKNMNPLARKVLEMQMKLCMKKKMARRFTTEEKLLALSIYKQGPKSYRFLQKIFILPSKTTLKNMISQLNIGVGINPQILELIKNQIKDWDANKKLCTIMFDEMALETAVTYSAKTDDIVGFVHVNEKKSNFADHVLVFMLRGAVCKWQQPLAFYFCEGATSSSQLIPLIKEVVAAVVKTGLEPIALVCDQGSNFQSTLNYLLEESKGNQLRAGESFDNTINLSGQKLNIFYDPPHLIKGIRNNWLTKDMIFKGEIAKWQDIVDVYNADCKHGESRILHKLSDQHVIPEKIKKMKVKNCVRVLSKSVSAALSYTSRFPLYPDGKPVSSSMKNTAEAIDFFDNLFDSANGTSTNKNNKKRRKALSTAVSSNTVHHKYWREAIKILQNIKFVSRDKVGKSVPSLKNWVVTLKSLQRVWGSLQKRNIKIMRPRYFNSDPLENFFGQVRAYNYRSNDPNPYAFINTFKSLLITRYINFHSDNFNCENESSQELLNIQTLFERKPIVNTATVAADVDASSNEVRDNETSFELEDENFLTQVRRERLNIHSRAYTVGWVTRKILMKINCDECRTNLITNNESDTHAYIKQKEYKTMKQRKLTYPTENAVVSFGNIISTTNEYLEKNPHSENITKKIKQQVFSKYSFDFLTCESHKEITLEWFLNFTIKLFIFNWCNIINRILKGTDVARLLHLNVPPIQAKALNKFKKKLKNKRINK